MADKLEEAEPMAGDAENPPTYTEASGAPPSYDSLFGKIKKAKHESSGNVDFARRTIGMILCGTVVCSLCTVCMLAIPVSMIVMGALHLDKCPRERFIPIYLLVGGSFGVLKAFMNAAMTFRRHRSDQEESEKAKPNPLESLVDCFMFAWFIAEREEADLQCNSGEVIQVNRAIYGATGGGTCVWMGSRTGCTPLNALQTVRDECEGTQRCTFPVNNTFLGSDPCKGYGKSLDLEYQCVMNQDET